MRIFTLLALLSLMFCSCTITQPHSRPAQVEGELYHDPQAVFSPDFQPENARLWNIKLGDPESAIPASRILSHNVQGWIRCRDGSRYRIDQGIVVTLGIWDPRVLARLNLTSPEKIEEKFGPTSTIDLAEPLKIYRYRNGKLAVLWNEQEKLVNAINISK